MIILLTLFTCRVRGVEGAVLAHRYYFEIYIIRLVLEGYVYYQMQLS